MAGFGVGPTDIVNAIGLAWNIWNTYFDEQNVPGNTFYINSDLGSSSADGTLSHPIPLLLSIHTFVTGSTARETFKHFPDAVQTRSIPSSEPR